MSFKNGIKCVNFEKECSKMNIDENWEDLKFFLALAKTGKLLTAAKLIKSNHTTVYRRIKNFEDNFNVKLFDSTPEGYHLTVAGEELYARISKLEDQMDDIFSSIHGLESELKGRVTVTTTHSIAATFLPDILCRFRLKWPALQIDLKVSNDFYNLNKREADIAIRPSSDIPLHLIGRNAGKIQFGMFCSKKYLKENGTKKRIISKLNEQTVISLDESLAHLKSSQWLRKMNISEDSLLYVDNVNVMAELCSSGLGVAVLPEYYAKYHHNLELLKSPKENIGSDLWVLTHKGISKSPKIKACTDFFFEEIKKILE